MDQLAIAILICAICKDTSNMGWNESLGFSKYPCVTNTEFDEATGALWREGIEVNSPGSFVRWTDENGDSQSIYLSSCTS